MNKILHNHFVRISVAVLFVGVAFAVGQTILNLLRFGFSMNNSGKTNQVAVR